MFDLVEALDSTTRCPRRSTGRRCADSSARSSASTTNSSPTFVPGNTFGNVTKPCIWPGTSCVCTATPAASSATAYFCPSSRSTSCSARSTTADGRPASDSARSGAASQLTRADLYGV